MTTITLTKHQTETYDSGDESTARDMLRPIIEAARIMSERTSESVTIETADGITIYIVREG